jgi:transcriptional antiterminator RfaH
MSSSTPFWYAVQTHPHAESKAAAHLLRQGFEVYLPRYLKQRRHARKVDMVAAPLFPRYLFVAIDLLAQRWRAVNSTFGVTQLVCQGDLPALVPGAVIAGLRQREDERGFFGFRPAFAPGDKIRVVGGAFSDCLGLVEGMGDNERVAILLELLGRKVRVFTNQGAIEAA